MKSGIKVEHDYTVFNYGLPRPHKNINYQYRRIVSWEGVNSAKNCVLPGNSKEKVGKEINPDALLMDTLETSFTTTVDKASGNTGGEIVERFMKYIASESFGHPLYFLDETGPYISTSGSHEDIFQQ